MSTVEPPPITLPYQSTLALRLYARLPRIHRVLDVRNDYALLRYICGAMSFGGELDDMIESLRGWRPIGPATPEPWDLDAPDLQLWRDARRTVLSLLADPVNAPAEWLPYQAQLVGAYLPAAAGLQERRDIISDATSGYKAGSAGAIADAARSALTGSRYVLVQRFTRGDGTAGTMWDVTLRTRATETPDPAAVLATVIRKGAKPAGVRLWQASFGTSWDKIEALFPTWTDWDAHTWDQIEEAGITYADVPSNLAPGASFENGTDIAKWVPVVEGGGTISTWALNAGISIDGANSGRLTKVGATGGMRVRTAAAITGMLPGRDYAFSLSAQPSAATPMSLVIDWQTSAGAAISSTTVVAGTAQPGGWNRSVLSSRHTSPANAARAVLNVVAPATVAAGRVIDLDAVLFRLITTTGG